MASTSRSDLMDEYHRLAADTLLGAETNKVAVAILQAAENGELERLQKLLGEHKDLVDARHPESGDTPLISAARSGHREVVDVLLSCGADITLENDSGESVLDVAGNRLRKQILKSSHEDRSMTNAKALLQCAWLGDAVTVRRCLSGSHYLDVNNSNSDGLTPLLLVTRDVSFFSQVQTAMETEFDPVDVLEQLLSNHADVNESDRHGRGPLHLIASSGPSIHATKMVSLLLQHGSAPDSLSSSSQSPLHVASSHGHLTVIVALVEEGGADVNLQTSETGDTPLILSVRGGHNKAARYLLSKGADVTKMNDSGDSALTMAHSPRMKRMIREAWTEQSEQAATETKSGTDNERDSAVTSPLSPGQPDKHSFFLTDRQMSRSLDFDDHKLTGQDDRDLLPGAQERRSKEELTATHPLGESRERDLSHDQPQPRPGDPRSAVGGERDRDMVAKKTPSKAGAASRKKPSRLLSQTKRESHDSHVTGRRPQNRAPQPEKHVLPHVFTYLSHPTSRPPSVSSRNQDRGKLPNLNLRGMKALKVVTVDTKQDNLRVRQLPKNTGSESPLQRSRSLMTPASAREKTQSLGKKRNSTGSITHFSPPDSKGVLQPSVVAPKLFDFSSQSTPPVAPSSQPTSRGPSHQPHPQRRLQSVPVPTPSFQPQGNRISLNFPAPQLGTTPPQPPPLHPALSVVIELSESPASSTHSDHTPLATTPGSEGSTLKASSQSEFETDSLERRHTPTQATPINNHTPSSARPHPALSPVSLSPGLPPTVGQFYQMVRQPSIASSTSSHTVTNYAVAEGSAPLSPIWNLDQPQSGSSSGSDYITTVISVFAAGPSVLPGLRSNPGLDSGHSTDNERPEEGEEEEGGSSGSSSEAEPVAVDATRSLQWKRGKLLGKGAFGKVWEGLLDSAQMIAVKEVELDIVGQKAQSQYEKLKLEVEILRSVRHRNVVSYLGTSMDEGHVYIFMDLIPGGSLLSILKRFGSLTEKICSHYTRQIVQALKYLHSNGIVHRDIKGANVMVTPRGVIKLIDFGSAKQEVARDMISVRGTPYWMAPEVIRGEGHGRKSDVWSLGCTVHEMATSKPPWGDQPPETAIFQIGSGTPIPPLPNRLSSELISFMRRCVIRDPTQRPGADQLLDDSFFTKFTKRRRAS